jgi:hypothetical protein
MSSSTGPASYLLDLKWRERLNSLPFRLELEGIKIKIESSSRSPSCPTLATSAKAATKESSRRGPIHSSSSLLLLAPFSRSVPEQSETPSSI